jgi:hypothetical protein
MDTTDDFELLGKAVARVLRESFATAAAGRAQAPDLASLDDVLAELRALPAKVRAEREAEALAFQASLAEARATVALALDGATEAAEAIRAQAVADAQTIVDGAAAEIARARQLVAEERVRLDTELKTLVRGVRRDVAKLESAAQGDHAELLDRATTEAHMILRQARLHHRSTAKEVDRMIEAAAAEAAALRKTALADAARVAARIRGVVDVPREAPAEPRLLEWRKSAPVADAEPAPAPAPPASAEERSPEHRPGRRRGARPLAS